MQLKLEELKKVVDQITNEERSVNALREEIERVLGPSVVTNVKLDQLAEEANYRIDVLERTGRFTNINFKPSVLLKFANSNSVEARKLAARLLPENFANKFKNDSNSKVRHAYAKRTALKNVLNMLRENPRDHELRYIIKQKRIQEAGIPQPKVLSEPYEMNQKKLGDAAKQQNGAKLSNLWYSEMAHKFLQDYGTNLEGNWEEVLIKRFCSSIKSMSNVEIDEPKLYKEIIKKISDREDRVLKRNSIKESSNFTLSKRFDERESLASELLQSNCSSTEYVKRANKLFSIVNMTAPNTLRKYRMTEGKYSQYFIPCKGTIPGNKKITSVIEEALDKYVKCWNELQVSQGEPIKIDWSPNPTIEGSITFNAELRL